MQLRTNALRATSRQAFTLMEVLVVVAILVVLAGVGIAVFRYLDESKEKIAAMGAKKIETAVTAYATNNDGNFPDSLEVLIQPSDGKPAYLNAKDLLDPWNKPYQYDPHTRSGTGQPSIISSGAPGANKPIRNW